MVKFHRNALQPGHRVQWYEIAGVLGQGGFGITYLALDSNLDQRVAVKEYLPVELAARDADGTVHPVSGEHAAGYAWGLERFVSEARTLARFDHPNIVRVLTVFEANRTAYMVMRFEEGQALSAMLAEHGLAEQRLLAIALALIDGLSEVHAAGFIHRDIKPANIYIRADGSPVLLDFGSARQALGVHTQTLTSMVSPGYAPYEQYMSDAAQQGPWTDIYALGATLYRAACGTAPMAAVDRSKPILHGSGDFLVPAAQLAAGRYSPAFLAAIDHALAFRESERPQTLEQWRAELTGAVPIEALLPPGSARTATAGEAATVLEAPRGRGAPTGSGSATARTAAAGEATTVLEGPPAWGAPAVTRSDASRVPGDGTYAPGTQSPGAQVPSARARWGWPLAFFGALLAGFVAVPLGLRWLAAPDPAATPRRAAVATPAVPAPAAARAVKVPPAAPALDGERQERIQSLLRAAQADIDALRLTTPNGDNAYEKFNAVLALDPANTAARAGMEAIARRYLELARNAARDRDWIKLQSLLDKAHAVDPDNADIARVTARLRDLRRKQERGKRER